MQIFHYTETGEYLGEGVADLDPIEQLPMVPGHATTLPPPLPLAGQLRIFLGGSWQYQAIPLPPVPPVPTQAELVQRKKDYIEVERDQALVQPVLCSVSGIAYTWQADLVSQRLLSDAVTLTAVNVIPCPAVWRTLDNKNVAVTLADLKNITKAITAQTQAAYQTSWQLKAQADAALTAADLDAIVWDFNPATVDPGATIFANVLAYFKTLLGI